MMQGLLVATVVAFGAKSSAATEVPFDFVDGQVVVEVTLPDGSVAPMNLDTGVFPSVFDNSLASRLGIRTGAQGGPIAGLGSRELTYRRATVESVGLGDFLVQDLPIIITETTHLVVGGRPLLGTLGESFFRSAQVEINYPARTVRLWSLGEPAPAPAGSRLAVDLSGPTPNLALTVNGVAARGWLDTGGSTGLVMSDATARELGLARPLDEARTVDAVGAQGAFKAKLVRIDSVEIGGFTVRDVNALVVPGGPTWVGNEVWREFVLRLDYAAGSVTVNGPVDPPPSRPSRAPRPRKHPKVTLQP